MGEVIETLPEHRSSLAAPIVFVVVVAFQFFSGWLEQSREGGVKSATATRLPGEIEDILTEASSLSQPSTFAQAAKLRRIAAAKEKELANWKMISWAGGVVNENVMVGIIPWLILSTRVSKFVCRLAKF